MNIRTKEQRKHHRHDCRVPIQGKAGSSFDKICAVDICQNGLGIVTQSSLKINSRIPIELELREQDPEPLVVMGQVKWITPIAEMGLYRIGFRFSSTAARGSSIRIKEYFQKKV